MRTPSPPSDIIAVFPALAGHERTTTRLHPAPGAPTASESSIGGPLWWPADEPWPHARGRYEIDRSRPAGSRQVQGPPVPLLAGVQLWVRDVPELPHPDGIDLLQILWDSSDEVDAFDSAGFRTAGPDDVFRVVWRRAADVVEVLTDQPRQTEAQFILDTYVPVPCVLNPERVVEYPPSWVLGEEFAAEVDARDKELGTCYGWEHTYADGTKIGGWPADSGVGGPYYEAFRCECGAGLEAFLTLASTEVAHNERTTTTTYYRPAESEPHEECSQPTGLVFGRWTHLQLFYCPASWDHPIQRFEM
ncbi:hypothetical protein [Myceligenerans indicum]|uniref:DUF1963 domain-containing protein n=1 Tax=Myceligenerans indicum TaxID=2593663 RepID=A0ABS1LQ41_9MICO|nr:hypothetical protein [Myceligenerans indicum]MBL0888315.1 DUF1963 domain-containing protein [Myceligenerans indicum]